MSAAAQKPSPSHPWQGRYRRAPEPHVEIERTCRACGETKVLGEFRLVQSRWRERVCIACRKARQAKRQLARRDLCRERLRRYRASGKYARTRRAWEERTWREGGWTSPPRAWWTTMRAAVELGLGESRVRQLCAAGVLTAMRATGRHEASWRVDPASVAALLAQREAA